MPVYTVVPPQVYTHFQSRQSQYGILWLQTPQTASDGNAFEKNRRLAAALASAQNARDLPLSRENPGQELL